MRYLLIIALLATPALAWLKPGVVKAEKPPLKEAQLISMPTIHGEYEVWLHADASYGSYLDGVLMSMWWGDWDLSTDVPLKD